MRIDDLKSLFKFLMDMAIIIDEVCMGAACADCEVPQFQIWFWGCLARFVESALEWDYNVRPQEDIDLS